MGVRAVQPDGCDPIYREFDDYSGGADDFVSTPLQQIVEEVEAGRFKPPIGRVFRMDDIVEAHREMEENTAGGKIVVVT